MNKDTVNEMVNELENADTTYQNCNDLAALYIIRGELGANRVEAEINDILPAYKKYVAIKTKYHHGETTKDSVISAIELVCREIYDLIKMLYSCSDMPLERLKIQNMIEAAKDSVGYN